MVAVSCRDVVVVCDLECGGHGRDNVEIISQEKALLWLILCSRRSVAYRIYVANLFPATRTVLPPRQ